MTSLAAGRPPKVRRLAVFRALMVGDLLCATPALRALRQHFREADITFVGLPWAREWAGRQASIDHFMAFPGHADLPEQTPDAKAWAGFAADMRGRGFDLLVQMHGRGDVTNPMLNGLDAGPVAGFSSEGIDAPRWAQPWPQAGSEVERWLQLTDALGAARQGTGLDFPLTAFDHRHAATLLHTLHPALLDGRPYVCIHPGARWPSRRWPVERFSLAAEALVMRGYTVLITGTDGEQPLAAALLGGLSMSARGACIDLTGRTSLWTLGAILKAARLVLCNDTGVSHVATAVGAPSVVVSCGSDVARWAPLDQSRHRVLWIDRACRPCHDAVCARDHECARLLTADRVIRSLLDMLDRRDEREFLLT